MEKRLAVPHGVPRGVLDVWQRKELRECDLGSVAIAGLASKILDLWQVKELDKKGPGRQ